jgi:hypothetical protein
MDDIEIDCWIAGCAWSEAIPMDLARQMKSVEFDDLHIAHLWSAHTHEQILGDIERRVNELATDHGLTQEQREDRVAIIRIMRVAMTSMIEYPLPDDPM